MERPTDASPGMWPIVLVVVGLLTSATATRIVPQAADDTAPQASAAAVRSAESPAQAVDSAESLLRLRDDEHGQDLGEMAGHIDPIAPEQHQTGLGFVAGTQTAAAALGGGLGRPVHPDYRPFVRGMLVASAYPLFNGTQLLTAPGNAIP